MTADYQRLDEIEIKMMDLENSVNELNLVIIRQAEEIDTLKLAQQRTLQQLAAIERPNDTRSAQQQADADNAPPPHY